MMRVTNNEIKTLSKIRSKLAISIYMKMEQGPGNIDKNRIHLKNLLKDLVEQAQRVGYTKDELCNIGDWIMSHVVDEERFIKGDGQTMVVFANDEILKTHYLHQDFEEQYYAGIEFITLPLSRAIERDHRFLLLALSQGQTRIFEASLSDIHELHLKDLPKSLEDGMQIDELGRVIQGHGAGHMSGSGTEEAFHGQGGVKDTKKKMLQEYFRRIDRSINKNLKKRGLPLLVFGVDYLHPIYRKISSYPMMLGKGIVGSPDKLSLYELHHSALNEAQKYFESDSTIPRAYA